MVEEVVKEEVVEVEKVRRAAGEDGCWENDEQMREYVGDSMIQK